MLQCLSFIKFDFMQARWRLMSHIRSSTTLCLLYEQSNRPSCPVSKKKQKSHVVLYVSLFFIMQNGPVEFDISYSRSETCSCQ